MIFDAPICSGQTYFCCVTCAAQPATQSRAANQFSSMRYYSCIRALYRLFRNDSFTFALFSLLLVSNLYFYSNEYYKYFLISTLSVGRSNKDDIFHVFLYRTFIFEKSTSFQTEDNDTLVALFLTDPKYIHRVVNGNLRCLYKPNREEKKEYRVLATVEKMQSLDMCRLDTFVLTCTFPSLKRKNGLEDPLYAINFGRSLYGYGLGVTSEFHSPFSTVVTPKTPDRKPRSMVMCLSRVFAFEKWRLLITVLEIYRQLGVNLVVTHVNSAHPAVFDLMKVYEGEGILSVRTAIKFPYVSKEMSYNPNAETEFSHQLALGHDCFYEFRESAEFIALLDWDDLLIARPFLTLPTVMRKAVRKNPKAAYFSINKIEGSFEDADIDHPREFNLREQIEHHMPNRFAYNTEKIIVRPKYVRGFWMHSSIHLRPGYKKVQLGTDEAHIFHMSSGKANEEDESRYLPNVLNLTNLEHNFNRFYYRPDVAELHSRLPLKESYFDAIRGCSSNITTFFKVAKKHVCLNYHLCEMPKLRVKCVNTVSVFKTQRVGRYFRIHYRIAEDFEESSNGCST
ncbi:glycosyltransferase family 92 domain-containing protein [Ditylenchus destructor]|nr:glycosyltransferase family 92 domain-containing protein [Ditylenchus destructor]